MIIYGELTPPCTQTPTGRSSPGFTPAGRTTLRVKQSSLTGLPRFAVSDTHPAILGSASRLAERLRQRLWCRETQGTNRRLCVRDTEKEVLVVLLIVQAYIRSLVKFGSGGANSVRPTTGGLDQCRSRHEGQEQGLTERKHWRISRQGCSCGFEKQSGGKEEQAFYIQRGKGHLRRPNSGKIGTGSHCYGEIQSRQTTKWILASCPNNKPHENFRYPEEEKLP
jgi:hypothetical protein